MSRCKNCSKISLESIFQSQPDEHPDTSFHGRTPMGPDSVLVADDEAELERSAEAGCDICGIVWQALHFFHQEYYACNHRLPPHSIIRLQSHSMRRISIEKDCSDGMCRWQNLTHAGSKRLPFGQEDGHSSAEQVADRTQIAKAHRLRNVNRDLGYFSDLALAWLDVCESEHECFPVKADKRIDSDARGSALDQSGSSPDSLNTDDLESANKAKGDVNFLPPRLIHISGRANKPTVRLVDTSMLSKQVRYCALSYCWGGCNQKATTQFNLPDRYMTIQYDELPGTLRDAIKLTLGLKIDYLWVDSLCIVQGHSDGSAPDWSEHVSIMGLIYERAYCTLIASNAPHADSGFLHRENVYFARFGVRACRIPYASADESSYLTYVFEHDRYIAELTPTPLEKRTWALQEHLLSSRRLIFKDSGLKFECKEKWANETNPLALQSLRQGTGLYTNYQSAMRGHPMSWYDLIGQFCRLQLSFGGDKLAAYEGIAREYCRRKDPAELFVAGIRRSMSAYDLCWANFSDSSSRNPSFPSWSWASTVEADLEFPYFGSFYAKIPVAKSRDLSVLRAEWAQAGSPGFATTPKITEDGVDAPLRAAIEVRGLHGRICGARLSHYEQRLTWDSRRFFRGTSSDDQEECFYKDPGIVISPQRDDYKWVLLVVDRYLSKDYLRWYILILEAADHQERSWRRIGILASTDLKRFCTESDIKTGTLSRPRGDGWRQTARQVKKKLGLSKFKQDDFTSHLEQGDLTLV